MPFPYDWPIVWDHDGGTTSVSTNISPKVHIGYIKRFTSYIKNSLRILTAKSKTLKPRLSLYLRVIKRPGKTLKPRLLLYLVILKAKSKTIKPRMSLLAAKNYTSRILRTLTAVIEYFEPYLEYNWLGNYVREINSIINLPIINSRLFHPIGRFASSILFDIQIYKARLVLLSVLIKNAVVRLKRINYSRYYYKLSVLPFEINFILSQYTTSIPNEVDFWLYIPNYFGILNRVVPVNTKRVSIRKILTARILEPMLKLYSLNSGRILSAIIANSLSRLGQINIRKVLDVLLKISSNKTVSLFKDLSSHLNLVANYNALKSISRTLTVQFNLLNLRGDLAKYWELVTTLISLLTARDREINLSSLKTSVLGSLIVINKAFKISTSLTALTKLAARRSAYTFDYVVRNLKSVFTGL